MIYKRRRQLSDFPARCLQLVVITWIAAAFVWTVISFPGVSPFPVWQTGRERPVRKQSSCATLFVCFSSFHFMSTTETTDPAVLLPEGLWHKLHRKVSFNDSRRGGEVVRVVFSCRKSGGRWREQSIGPGRFFNTACSEAPEIPEPKSGIVISKKGTLLNIGTDVWRSVWPKYKRSRM